MEDTKSEDATPPLSCLKPSRRHPVGSRFGVRPLIFFGGGYLVPTGLFALVPFIQSLESALPRQREKAARAADGATK